MIKELLSELRCFKCGSYLLAMISPNREYIEVAPCEVCKKNVVEETLNSNP